MPSTSVYLPDSMLARLKQHLDKTGNEKSTNSIIVSALEEYLDRYEDSIQWSDRFLDWGGEENSAGIELERTAWREIEL